MAPWKNGPPKDTCNRCHRPCDRRAWNCRACYRIVGDDCEPCGCVLKPWLRLREVEHVAGPCAVCGWNKHEILHTHESGPSPICPNCCLEAADESNVLQAW